MLQLPQTADTTATALIPIAGESRLRRVMARIEETLALLFEAEAVVGGTPQQSALFDQYNALIDEAACSLPASEDEAIFLFILAGAEGDMIMHGARKRDRAFAELRQRTLMTAALTFFDPRHRKTVPHTWEQFTCDPSCLPKLVDQMINMERGL